MKNCEHLGSKEHEAKRWAYCFKFASFTNRHHCGVCQSKGQECIEDFFDRRDGRKPNRKVHEPRQKPKKSRAERVRRAKRIEIPLEIESACRSCHQSKNCPNTSVCCGGQILVHPQVPCPQGKWEMPVSEEPELVGTKEH